MDAREEKLSVEERKKKAAQEGNKRREEARQEIRK